MRETGRYWYPGKVNDGEQFHDFYASRDVNSYRPGELVGIKRGYCVPERPERYFCGDRFGLYSDCDQLYGSARNATEEERGHNVCWNSIDGKDLMWDLDEISEDNYSKLPDPLIRLPKRKTSTCDNRGKKKLIDFHPEREQTLLSNFDEFILSVDGGSKTLNVPGRQDIGGGTNGYVTISDWHRSGQALSEADNNEPEGQDKIVDARRFPAKRYEPEDGTFVKRTTRVNEEPIMLDPRSHESLTHIQYVKDDVPRIESIYGNNKVRYFDEYRFVDKALFDRDSCPRPDDTKAYENHEPSKTRAISLLETGDRMRTRPREDFFCDKDVCYVAQKPNMCFANRPELLKSNLVNLPEDKTVNKQFTNQRRFPRQYTNRKYTENRPHYNVETDSESDNHEAGREETRDTKNDYVKKRSCKE